ncbi:SMI1/KNR4 family protein [Pseudomonas protegens]|uniref:SMI1/KNR4 family protein n=2 Tax=Pseudomonas protegens TaxID=380021 RepID=UPI000CD04C5A|nr:SMI1/KNR4 family protein [Pseudomonas protegens]MBP5100091.1 SMI1/KNR4 family protein [Pseudomonas protegens]MBP5116467.1 SMI1/KNR4 family protein [Pseudomonas protegens]MBP5123919.1 SMI1/KNR4 family protein [Pseudomonas protegens]POA90842.1 SMI1/KNR4 family protein [Pseudomonas protegens]QTU08838.1 SMI1/KNR4 family protein [Pseudomonas protegens]
MTDQTTPEQWPPAGCPLLAWPNLPDQAARLNWYLAAIGAYGALWEGHVNEPELTPVSEDALQALEQRLGCPLPRSLRDYHRQLGVLSLAEVLCSVGPGHTPIQPLLEAYPGIVEISDVDLVLAGKLVAFGDYLGNGNLFCFHRESGAVYYFDHDTGTALTRFFDSPEEYLDTLMLLCLAEVYDDDDAAEALISQRYGEDLVRKWRY